MIRRIRGKVLEVNNEGAIIEVAGFGVLVRTNGAENLVVGAETSFATRLAVKQDGIDLYGFSDPEDRDFFERMLSVSGVGPKTALGILRRATRENLEGAIAKRDIGYLTKVVGLGKKNAEKLAVELAEKIGNRPHDDEDGDVFDTLVALGYTEREARRAVQTIPSSITGKDARLKSALGSSKS